MGVQKLNPVYKTLLEYIPRKNSQYEILELLDNQNEICSEIEFKKISPELWGAFFERYVGSLYENRGYKVEYRGIEKGLFDGGIDLICIKSDESKMLVQCKFGSSNLGKQKIEQILFKAGETIFREFKNEKLKFVLALSDKMRITQFNEQRFLRYNSIQSDVDFRIDKLAF